VASASFRLLYVTVSLAHERRRIIHTAVTEHPTAAWLSHQITEAFPWDTAPRYLLCDRDGSYGAYFCNRVEAMGIMEVITAPWTDRASRPHKVGRRFFAITQLESPRSICTSYATVSFKLLYALVILHHGRRRLVTVGVTPNPTAEWVAGQVTENFPWNEAPRLLIRDRDGAYGHFYTRRARSMGIRDHPIPPRSPWQNGHVERLIGSNSTPMPRPPDRVR
jgi:hypothetical protein